MECKDGTVQEFAKKAGEHNKRAAQVETKGVVETEEEGEAFQFQPWADQEDQRACMAWLQQDPGVPVVDDNYQEWRNQIEAERLARRNMREEALELDRMRESQGLDFDQDRVRVKQEVQMLETFYLPEQAKPQFCYQNGQQEEETLMLLN